MAPTSIVIFALYINSPAVMVLYRHPEYMWAIALVLFYWIIELAKGVAELEAAGEKLEALDVGRVVGLGFGEG